MVLNYQLSCNKDLMPYVERILMLNSSIFLLSLLLTCVFSPAEKCNYKVFIWKFHKHDADGLA